MFDHNPFATHTLEILIMLLGAFVIGLWMGWVLWGRLKAEVDRLRIDNQSLNVTLDAIRLEIDALKTRAVVAETDNANYATQVLGLNREISSLKERAIYLENELTLAQQHNRLVESELTLSLAPDTPLSDDIPLEIKNLTAEPTAVSEPEPELEPLATTESEPETTAVPEEPEIPVAPVFVLEPTPVEETPAVEPEAPRVEAPAPEESPSAMPDHRDDLTVVEGIGPKIQMLLNQYGIFTYRQLADSDVARLKEILAAAGSQLAMHDPGTWPSQANLAANDQWDTLKSVQGFLKGGKRPD